MTSILKQGSSLKSTFTLIAATLGAGIITLPYLSAENGIVLSTLLIAFSAVLSYFVGMLLVKETKKIGKTKYEDFAEHCWGPKMAKIVGWCNVITLLGFVVSYIVFVKTLVPHILIVMFGENNIPELLGSGLWKGQIVWATIFTVLLVIPV
jgi:amino acid permease